MKVMSGEHYQGQRVVLDDTHFEGCTFNDCVLIYSGEGLVSFERCQTIGCTFGFDGPATRTLAFIATLYKSQPQFVEQYIFEHIRRDTMSRVPGTPPDFPDAIDL